MLIGMSGHRGVGKSVAANYLVSFHDFKLISFAADLKKKAALLFPFTDRHLYGDLKEAKFDRHDWSSRDFLIGLGNFIRYYDKDYWVREATKNIDLKKGNYVIDDLRFLNEVEFLKNKGAKLIRISRYAKMNPYKGEINDASEHELDDYKEFDYKINEMENYDLKRLYIKLNHIMEDINEAG